MTAHKSFKRLVRARMGKTGESYTAARARLLAGTGTQAGEEAPLPTTDAAIRQRTGRGWEEWFDLLDDHGASGLRHAEIARWVARQLGIEPLAWNAQAITTAYERARRGRAVGEREEGFTAGVSRTTAVPREHVYDAFVSDSNRRRWLPGETLRERTATRPKSARFDWGDGRSRVHVTFEDKGETKSTVFLSHERLADVAEAERMKAFWRERLDVLKAELEAGENDA